MGVATLSVQDDRAFIDSYVYLFVTTTALPVDEHRRHNLLLVVCHLYNLGRRLTGFNEFELFIVKNKRERQQRLIMTG